jgi:hypothetical protein
MSPHSGYAAAQSDRDQPGLFIDRGMNGIGSLGVPGTAANTLANVTPDDVNPTAQTVFDSFTNDHGGTQPGVLALDPNATANNLSFVQPPPVSTQCELISTLNANPLLFIGGTFVLFYLLNQGHGAYQRRKAAR